MLDGTFQLFTNQSISISNLRTQDFSGKSFIQWMMNNNKLEQIGRPAKETYHKLIPDYFR
jgi:hypothetical protein